MSKVAILMGSEKDAGVMGPASRCCPTSGIAHEVMVMSAHRNPGRVAEFAARRPPRRVLSVVICGAGKAAHLAGAVAANTTLPVIGIPIAAGGLGGLDALLATVQMPTGVPVATVAVDGAANAAYLAAVDHLRHRSGGRPTGSPSTGAAGDRALHAARDGGGVVRRAQARGLEGGREPGARGMVDQGVAPPEAAAALRRAPEVDPAAWKAREEETRHDLAAFVDVLAASLETGGEWVHYGLTSSDVLDTALGVIIAEATDCSSARAATLFGTIRDRRRWSMPAR